MDRISKALFCRLAVVLHDTLAGLRHVFVIVGVKVNTRCKMRTEKQYRSKAARKQAVVPLVL